jgi:1-acyl-sn-glycerol-3-phosphate acyltransferase
MKIVILGLYSFFDKRPFLLRGLLIGIILLLLLLVLQINFVEDISKFLPEKDSNRRINYAYQHIGASNRIMVNVSLSNNKEIDKDKIVDAVDVFVERLSEKDSSSSIKDIFYLVDQEKISYLTSFIIQNLPYFIDDSDYKKIDSLIEKRNIEKILIANKEVLISPMSSFMKDIIAQDPLFFSGSALSKLNQAQSTNSFELYNGYIFTKDEKEAMIAVSSKYPVSETSKNEELIKTLKEVANSVEEEFGNEIKIDFIGASVISISNANQIKKDSIISTSIALILILLLLLIFFRNLKALFVILFSLIFGGIFSLAFLVIFKDSVSIIAIGIGSIISGIAVNYPLHFLAHLQHSQNREETIKDIIFPLIIGNITTVGAFLSLIFISSDAMRDLGLFSSFLLIGTILFVLVFLPHFFKKTLFSGNKESHSKLIFGKLANLNLEKNKVIVLIVILLTIPLFFLSKKTNFETDLNAINYMTKEQRIKLNKLIKETESTNPSLYCVAEGKEIDDALENYEKASMKIDSLMKDSTIIKQSGISIFLPSKKTQELKLDKWHSYWENRREGFLNDLRQLSVKNGYNENSFNQFEEIINKKYSVEDISYFEPIVSSFANNYISTENDISLVFTILETKKDNLNMVSNSIDKIDDNVFAFNNKSVIEKMVDILSDDFNYVLYICSFIVFLVLTISYGRIELSLLAFAPLLISWIWILGIMNLFGISFNIVNIILASFIFGQGDDYTIFVTDGLMHEYKYRKKILASHKNSVLLSASIMFIGIGSLIIAKHPAMRSLAEVTIIGMICVVLMSYLIPPLIYRWLTERKGEYRETPITFINLFKTIYSFSVFLLGTLLLNIIGFFLLTIGKKSPKNKELFHKAICRVFRFTANNIPQIKSNIDYNNESFEKPGIIISNHQSHLDLMYLLMLNPKIICLTNKWVWNSPFYGWILRYADYYPVVDGIEVNEDKLKTAIDNGYSILIFPEGTRSVDGEILRFHKGAFYLADKLGVDIIPVITHGIGHVFPKKEFILKKGRVDIKILDRISSDDETYRNGKDYSITAKEIRKLYKEEYRKMADSIENADYFADLVYHNYIYKGLEVQRRAKKALKATNNFRKEIELMPETGEYNINNCGQGEISLLAALVKKNLQITASDPNKEFMEIASHCTSIPHNLKYIMDNEE